MTATISTTVRRTSATNSTRPTVSTRTTHASTRRPSTRTTTRRPPTRTTTRRPPTRTTTRRPPTRTTTRRTSIRTTEIATSLPSTSTIESSTSRPLTSAVTDPITSPSVNTSCIFDNSTATNDTPTLTPHTGPLIASVDTPCNDNSSYIYDVYSSPRTILFVTNTSAGETGLIFVNGSLDSFLLYGQRFGSQEVQPANITRRRRLTRTSRSDCEAANNPPVPTRTPISCDNVQDGINQVCFVLGDPPVIPFDSEAFVLTGCAFFPLIYPECVGALTTAFLATRIACDAYSLLGLNACDLFPPEPPAAMPQAPSIPPCTQPNGFPFTSQGACCVRTHNCPGETGHNCGAGCCCCPAQQSCCSDSSGCCYSP